MNDIFVINPPDVLFFMHEILTYKLPGEYQTCSVSEIKQAELKKKGDRFMDKKNREFFVYKDEEDTIFCLGARPIYQLISLQEDIQAFGKYKVLSLVRDL